jgi:hypothetical protein
MKNLIKSVIFIVVMLGGIALIGVGVPNLINAGTTSGAVYDTNIKNGLIYTISGVVMFLVGYKFF